MDLVTKPDLFFLVLVSNYSSQTNALKERI